ncbi:hypothetical protein BAU15_02920 [Enterococcus sp. JM4C]|nr:hypothetical protein BAU15_02920 [Enterococcus sp. JM4C]
MLKKVKNSETFSNDEGLEVLFSKNNGWQVSLKSSKEKLKRVQLTWTYDFPPAVQLLADAFERGYGDLAFQTMATDQSLFWYFIGKSILTNEMFGWGVKTNANALCQWQVTPESVDLWLDVRNGTQAIDLKERTLACATIVYKKIQTRDSFSFVADFCQSLVASKPLKTRPVYGGNDWYYAYGKNSTQLILEMADALSHYSAGLKNRPYMVVDDGWQVAHSNDYNGGPWNQSNQNFSSMTELANKIKEKSVLPGLWFRPLLQQKDPKIHEEMILKNDQENVILDPSHPAVLDWIQQDIQRFIGWGYEIIKHDFSTIDIFGQWGFEMGKEYFNHEVSFYDQTKTTAEIINQFYKAIREAAGEKLLIGCNTIGHLSVGNFDIQRTGDDTSGREFSRTRKMGVNTLAFRMPQHRHFYMCDADCVGITEDIPWAENREWFRLLAHSGTPLFISFSPEIITEEMEKEIIAGFKIAATNEQIAIPIDWEEHVYPQKWSSSQGDENYSWYAQPRNFELEELGKE